MKRGKLPENVLKRSVLKQIHTTRQEVLLGACVGEDCAAVKLEAGEVFVLSADPIIWTDDRSGKRAVYHTLNDLAASGAQPVGLLLTALLPEALTEAQMRNMVSRIEEVCAQVSVQILGGHTQVTEAVTQAVISVTGVGKVQEAQLTASKNVQPGDDLVATKWIGLDGTSRIACAYAQELQSRYPAYLIEEAQQFDRYLSVLSEADVGVQCGVKAMHDVTDGGIFGALWEFAESSGVGLEIDLKKIPIRQETVEICEFFDLNPYQLTSSGCLLLAASDGTALVRALERAGIPAAIIGKATAGNDRVLLQEDERRFLEPPKTDEIYKVGDGTPV